MKNLLLGAWLAIILAALGAAHGADPRVAASDAKAIRAVVQAQMDAFAKDDGPRAFSYASPGIRQQFGSHEVFIAMVRASYPVVYRPAAVRFLPAKLVEGEHVQPVQMTDGDGQIWISLYRMEKQKNGAWRIAGCDLLRAGTTAT